LVKATHPLQGLPEVRLFDGGRRAARTPQRTRRRQQPEAGAPLADPHDLLRQAEFGGERVAALFRVIIFASLLSVAAFTDQGLHRLDISTWLLLYGMGDAGRHRSCLAGDRPSIDPLPVRHLRHRDDFHPAAAADPDAGHAADPQFRHAGGVARVRDHSPCLDALPALAGRLRVYAAALFVLAGFPWRQAQHQRPTACSPHRSSASNPHLCKWGVPAG
jgi:hypothetical protein